MVEELLNKHPIISDQIDKRELTVILREFDKVLRREVPGDVVELGCYEGTTSLFVQRLLLAQKETRQFHVYDSFAGLPEKTAQDQSPAGVQFKSGELHTSKQKFIKNFQQAKLKLPRIHKAWFSDLQPDDMPSNIAFAFLDGDFYDSIRDSLRLIENRLAPGATIVVDDYQSEALPGAARAVDEWLKTKGYSLQTEASLAVIRT